VADELERWLDGPLPSATAIGIFVQEHRALILSALRALSAEPSAFLATTRNFQLPAPKLNIGGEPCGECHIRPGETCDICGASNPPVSLSEPSEAEVERVGRAIYLGLYERHGGRWECVETKDVWFDLARAALRSRRAEGGE
jgi:hypothetical protein